MTIDLLRIRWRHYEWALLTIERRFGLLSIAFCDVVTERMCPNTGQPYTDKWWRALAFNYYTRRSPSIVWLDLFLLGRQFQFRRRQQYIDGDLPF